MQLNSILYNLTQLQNVHKSTDYVIIGKKIIVSKLVEHANENGFV